MRIKVLPAQRWMLRQSNSFVEKPCPVRFNRPGIYLEGSNCWFEVNGQAWLYSRKQFKYDLDLLKAQELDTKKVQALAAVVEQRLATPRQREIYQMCLRVASLKKTERQYRRFRLRYTPRPA